MPAAAAAAIAATAVTAVSAVSTASVSSVSTVSVSAPVPGSAGQRVRRLRPGQPVLTRCRSEGVTPASAVTGRRQLRHRKWARQLASSWPSAERTAALRWRGGRGTVQPSAPSSLTGDLTSAVGRYGGRLQPASGTDSGLWNDTGYQWYWLIQEGAGCGLDLVGDGGDGSISRVRWCRMISVFVLTVQPGDCGVWILSGSRRGGRHGWSRSVLRFVNSRAGGRKGRSGRVFGQETQVNNRTSGTFHDYKH